MKFAICYKGIFNIEYIKQKGVDDNLINIVTKSIDNHFDKIINVLKSENKDCDIYLSTYQTNTDLDKIFIDKYVPKKILLGDFENINKNTWNAQLMHYKNLINTIKEENSNYDVFIFTRPDIEIHKNIKDFNIDYEKFNIVVEHPSGNCDDNLWIFPKKYFHIFENAITSLLAENKLTHEINKEIIKNGGDVHYMDNLIDSYMGHTLFTFIR